MNIFLFTQLTKDISTLDLWGLLIGHLLFAIALTKLLNWTWLEKLMNEEDKLKLLNGYNWKDLLVDGGIVAVVLGILFVLISLFL